MPLTVDEYLLTVLAEECAEVAQRASKAIRFTPEEVQPGQSWTNAWRVELEISDLTAVVEMLRDRGVLNVDPVTRQQLVDAKKLKIEKYMRYSQEWGTLTMEDEE